MKHVRRSEINDASVMEQHEQKLGVWESSWHTQIHGQELVPSHGGS